MSDVFICAVSGIAVNAVEDADEDEDGIPGLPPGWARIVVSTRRTNPEWAEVQAGIDTLSQVPDDAPPEARRLARLVARATFAALEPDEHVVTSRLVYVSAEQVPGLMEMLGLEEEPEEEPEEEEE